MKILLVQKIRFALTPIRKFKIGIALKKFVNNLSRPLYTSGNEALLPI